MMTHQGRVALVTGSGRGIGRAIADRLGEAGALIAYLDHDPSLAQTAADEAMKHGRKALGIAADIADADAIAEAVKTIEQTLGPIDILVNNAGISPKSGADGKRALAWEMDVAEWQRVTDVNLTGAFICARSVLPGMIARKRGAIVSTSSVAGKTFCDIVGIHYAATKAGLIGFTKHLAGEAGPYGINVNAVAPGRIDTPLMRGTASAANDAAKAATPMRRFGTPEDVAETVLFLTSDEACFVTGQVVDVAGGWLMT